eukprot:3763311-Rhodomonas_salina.3
MSRHARVRSGSLAIFVPASLTLLSSSSFRSLYCVHSAPFSIRNTLEIEPQAFASPNLHPDVPFRQSSNTEACSSSQIRGIMESGSRTACIRCDHDITCQAHRMFQRDDRS